MKRCLILFLVALFGCAGPVLDAQTPSPTKAAAKVAPKFTCVMHPEVVIDHPGKCPKCGMELVPRTEEKKESSPSPPKRDSGMAHSGHMSMSNGMMNHSMTMRSSINLADPMSREGSGTSWLPESTPMYGRMWMFGNDTLMLHGAAFPRYTYASTQRGDDRIDAPNWIMAMYSHPLSDSAQLGLRVMMSLDFLTEGGRGYPLLYQSGESWRGQPLHDRQHPHDLFSELSLTYSQKLTNDISAFLYFGYPGEPALGPPAFMHRLSAMDDPDAPIAHHWQDSTHITFGVLTGGLQWRDFKIEGSVFNGREPDETRYDFDQPRFDSASGRLSWNPTPNLALQVSHGYQKEPEALEPGVSRHRTTASAIYNLPLGPDANWASSFVWGQNNTTGEGKTQSFLLESDYQRGRDTVYTRLEYVEKSGPELVLNENDLSNIYPIYSASLGYVHDFSHGAGLDLGLGGQFTVSHRPDSLDKYYGDDLGYGWQVFLRIRPSRHGAEMKMDPDMARSK